MSARITTGTRAALAATVVLFALVMGVFWGTWSCRRPPRSPWSADAGRLAERIGETPSWRRRSALLDRFLLRGLERGPQPSAEVGWAWQRLVSTGGAAAIGRIAGEVGWSHRHLIVRFRQQVGLAPKTAARLVRFNAVWRRLDEGRRPDWADLAHDAGYADQAHLVRDFRQLTGMTPTGYLAQVNSVQAAVAAAS